MPLVHELGSVLVDLVGELLATFLCGHELGADLIRMEECTLMQFTLVRTKAKSETFGPLQVVFRSLEEDLRETCRAARWGCRRCRGSTGWLLGP